MLIVPLRCVCCLITKKNTSTTWLTQKISKIYSISAYKSVFISIEQKILFVYHNYLSPLGDGGWNQKQTFKEKQISLNNSVLFHKLTTN